MSTVNSSSPLFPGIYAGDVVTLIRKEGSVGTVLRVAWRPDSDDEHWEYFDGLDVSEEEEPLSEGQVEVVWADSQKVTITQHDQLRVLDRGFTHGDLVSPLSDLTSADTMTKTGTVAEVELTLDLKMLQSGQVFLLPSSLSFSLHLINRD